MRTDRGGSYKQGDVVETRGTGNAPGAGGVISTVIVTDKEASSTRAMAGGFECRDATPQEISDARASGKFKTGYC